MGNELNFRVGDVVCHDAYGDGYILSIKTEGDHVPFRDFPISVKFSKKVYSFTLDGKEMPNEPHASLHHGTWEQVFGNLPDLKPRRKVKRWANLYVGDRILYCKKFISPEEALNNSDKTCVAVAVEIEVDE